MVFPGTNYFSILLIDVVVEGLDLNLSTNQDNIGGPNVFKCSTTVPAIDDQSSSATK